MNTSLLKLLVFFGFLGGAACSGEGNGQGPARKALAAELAWEVSGFARPESAHYDAQRRQIYVSNIGGAPLDADRTGFLSLLGADGSIKAMRWVEGLQAPKGLALCDDGLYVADLNEILRVDVDTGQILHTWGMDAEEAGFINDVSCSPDGKVYISDMTKDRIHVLHDGQLSVWLESPELENPNGLFGADQGLLLASWGTITGEGFATELPGHIKQIDYATRQIISLGDATPLGNLDGLEIDKRGDYLVSDWVSGKVFRFTPQGERQALLALAQGAADLGYAPDTDTLIIPLMQEGKVQAYHLRMQGGP